MRNYDKERAEAIRIVIYQQETPEEAREIIRALDPEDLELLNFHLDQHLKEKGNGH